MKLFISEPEERHQGAILVHDEALNDIAEFYHSEHATVETSYETALMLARLLVEAAERKDDAGEYDTMLATGVVPPSLQSRFFVSAGAGSQPPTCAACEQSPKMDCDNPSCAFRRSTPTETKADQ